MSLFDKKSSSEISVILKEELKIGISYLEIADIICIFSSSFINIAFLLFVERLGHLSLHSYI